MNCTKKHVRTATNRGTRKSIIEAFDLVRKVGKVSLMCLKLGRGHSINSMCQNPMAGKMMGTMRD